MLAKSYEDLARYDDAEVALLRARDLHPRDATVHMQLAGCRSRGGVPTVVDGRVIGPVGVSGVASQDDVRIAEAGIAALGVK